MFEPKMATCCYCGRRTVLANVDRPSDGKGHGLACGACGAPLRRMKAIRVDRPAGARPPQPASPQAQPVWAALMAEASGRAAGAAEARRKKRRKPIWRRALEEIWDEVEDIFD